MNLYEYQAGECRFDVEKTSTSTRSHYAVSFPGPVPAEWEEVSTVYGDLFVPQGEGPFPLVIITHGYGDASLAPCLTLARLLVRHGIAAYTWYLPTHSRRLPSDGENKYMPVTPRQWLDVYRRAVIDLRRATDWLVTLPEIDAGRITAAGISMGAIVTLIAMAVDSRIGAGISIVAGGNMEELSWAGNVGDLFSGHGCTRADCEAVYARYPAYLEEVAKKGYEAVEPARECFLFDPLTFTGYLKSRPALMVAGEKDEMVSKKSTNYLWEALGRPRLVWVDDTHVGTYCQSNLLCGEITRFLDSIPERR